jgi:hypothetical protein
MTIDTRTLRPFLLLLLLLLLLALSAPARGATTPRAQVQRLPGWAGATPTRHFTGLVESEPGTHNFYYYVESQSDPSTDPLFLWMNGGPGASSLAGVFGENGPLLLTEEGTLLENPYAWNRRANVLAVEFAPGIGYSYCANSTRTDGGPDFCPANGDGRKQGACSPCLASDSSVARQTAAVLAALLGDAALFPELAGRPLYLLGESYAGVYLPTLARELLERHNDTDLVNLHGVWATDPCTDNEAQFGWLDLGVDFAYQKGLISHDVWTTLGGGGGNASPCVASRTAVGDRLRDTSTAACRRAWRLYDMATAGIGDAVHPAPIPGLPMYVDPLNAYGISGGPDLPGFLGSDAMRAALPGAAQSPNKPYLLEIGNNGYDQYTQEYAACNDHATAGMVSMVSVWRDVIGRGNRGVGAGAGANLREILILNGDVDPVVDMHGTEAAVRKMGYPVKTGEARRPWFFNATKAAASFVVGKPSAWGPTVRARGAGAQIGGFVVGFETGGPVQLRFVSVRNSGHMTPAYAPQKTLHTVERGLVAGKGLAPPLVAGWDEMEDEKWYEAGAFGAWVQEAMGDSWVGW